MSRGHGLDLLSEWCPATVKVLMVTILLQLGPKAVVHSS